MLMDSEVIIRTATLDDAPAICAIYAPYVEQSAVTFELEPPSAEEIRARMERVLQAYPYLVAERNGFILGFCYASAFRPRIAYIHSVETSIYVDQHNKQSGVGRALYERLIAILKAQNVYNANACIAYCDVENEYLTHGSVHFHERMGFTTCARFNKCGYKFDQWFDMIWMENIIAPHPDHPDDFIPFPLLEETFK